MGSLSVRLLAGHRLVGLKLLCAIVLNDLVDDLGEVILGYHLVELLLWH